MNVNRAGLGSSQLAVSIPVIKAPPSTNENCYTGSGGPLASNDICWFSYGSSYSISASIASGNPTMQEAGLLSGSPESTTTNVTETLPHGATVSFELQYVPKVSSLANNPRVLAETPSKVTSQWKYSAFANNYSNLNDHIILYSNTTPLVGGPSKYGPSKWEFKLSDITVSYDNQPVSNYKIVAADGETTNSGESVTFKTNGEPWQPVGNMLPAIGSPSLTFKNTCSGNSYYTSSSSVSALYEHLGIGTDTVKCVGGTNKPVGALVLSSANATMISATDTLTGPSERQGVVFGIEMPTAPQSLPTPTPTPAASLSLTKTESPSSPNPITKAGQSVTYDFVVTNTGNTTLNNLAITDTQSVPGEALNGPISCPVTSLAATASVTCTGSYTVTSTDITNAKVTDTAVATAATSTGTKVTSDPSTLTIPVSVPTTTSSKTVTPTTKTITPTTKSSSTTPAPVKLVTGPPTPPASSTNALPLGAGIAGLGIAGLGYLVIERKRKTQHGSTDEVA